MLSNNKVNVKVGLGHSQQDSTMGKNGESRGIWNEAIKADFKAQS
jgi:hypothetical protein